jgi:rhamnopyranosyl-N-acetylglucosaminyl-diphospho-decaprenol beta-1,3/1,4-galactofuranosyltransferase
MIKNMRELNVAAVVVTYNRLALLTEAIAALKNQTVAMKHLIVVNNGSTDNTGQWLGEQTNLIVIHQTNSGGAGGFYTGIRHAVTTGADFIWVMDDDCICEPEALEKLLEKIDLIKEPVGFIGSRCNWIDGSPHLMNIPHIKPLFHNQLAFNKYAKYGVTLTESCSFVSVLINAEAVKKVGLPYKEFFIWGDDQEFTSRITKYGYPGFYCPDSIVLHKTPANSFTDFYNDTPRNIWKHSHGFRNEFFMVKRDKGFLYFICWLPAKVIYASCKILMIRKKEHLQFIRAIFNAAWQSIFFNPKIDMVNTPTSDESISHKIPVLHKV